MRPGKYYRDFLLLNPHSLLGDAWREQRRFTLQTLKDFGLGTTSSHLQEAIHSEISELTRLLEEKIDHAERNGKTSATFPALFFFNTAVINVLWRIIGGTTFAHGDPDLDALIQGVTDVLTLGGVRAEISLVFPVLKSVLPTSKLDLRRQESYAILHKFVDETVRSHK